MNAHFANGRRPLALRTAAQSWLGTPFVPFANIRHHGVDCVNLCAELLKECHFTLPPNSTWPRYAMDGGKHNTESQLTAWLDACPRFVRIWSSTLNDAPYLAARPLAGDVLCFQIGRVAHHAGLLIEGVKFIHCLAGRKAMFATLSDPSFNKRLIAAYRPLEGTL